MCKLLFKLTLIVWCSMSCCLAAYFNVFWLLCTVCLVLNPACLLPLVHTQVKPDVRLKFSRQHSPAVPILVALMALGYALRSLGHLGALLDAANPTGSKGSLMVVGQHVLGPLLLAGGLLFLVQKNGRMLVDRPQLCPQLANTVGHAEKQK